MPFGLVVLKLLMNGLFLWTHFVEIALENSLLEILLSLGENLIFFFGGNTLVVCCFDTKAQKGGID